MKMPKIIFVPCPNSHRFERREIEVYEDVKVGRSVARSKTSPDNAIFDCKVLSRSHAVMWYQDGHVWIKDTSSSNGTFVNGTRLSKGGEESEPFKIESGDKIQFGVDVMEAKKKEGGNPVTHGCIHAKTTVMIPDEVLPNPNYVTNDPMLSARSITASSETLNGLDDDQDIIELHAAIKNACNRENLLHTRLQELEQRLGSAIEAAEIGWQALIKEDKLLARIELLENQLEIFTRNPTEDQQMILRLEDEKHKYQIHAKDSLRTICQEKAEVIRKCTDLEDSLTTAKIEVGHYKNICNSTQDELLKAQDEVRRKTSEFEHTEAELKKALESAKEQHETRTEELRETLDKLVTSHQELEGEKQILDDRLAEMEATHESTVEDLRKEMEKLKVEQAVEDAVVVPVVSSDTENELTNLRDENYRLQEELLKLKEELDGQCTEKDGVTRQCSTDAATNTEVQQTKQAPVTVEDQENQMNTNNIKDSQSQTNVTLMTQTTEKWFDAISPSSSKSDILSSSFSLGDRKTRSFRTRRDGGGAARPWNNTNAFEGSIAHAMALIESLDDIKSSCAKFREESEREDQSSEEITSEPDPSVSSDPALTSPPLQRRNSYREACEDEGHVTLQTDDTLFGGDDVSEADEHFELAPEDPERAVLNKGPATEGSVGSGSGTLTRQPEPPRTDSPNRQGSIKSRFRGLTTYVSSFWPARG